MLCIGMITIKWIQARSSHHVVSQYLNLLNTVGINTIHVGDFLLPCKMKCGKPTSRDVRFSVYHWFIRTSILWNGPFKFNRKLRCIVDNLLTACMYVQLTLSDSVFSWNVIWKTRRHYSIYVHQLLKDTVRNVGSIKQTKETHLAKSNRQNMSFDNEVLFAMTNKRKTQGIWPPIS